MKIGLALGGGGALSLSQIGVIKVFEREGIEFDIITGVSMGSVVGSLYSFTKDSKQLEEFFKRFINDRNIKKIEEIFIRHRKRGLTEKITDGFKNLYILFSDSFKTGLFDSEKVIEEVRKIFNEEIYIENSKINLGIVAVEYFTGKIFIFNRGKLFPAVVASCAMPGLLTLVEINGKKFIDGGVASNIPVISNYILGGEIIICVENEPSLLKNRPSNVFSTLVQVSKIKSKYADILEEIYADFKIEIELEGIEWYNFSQFQYCVKEGEKTAEKYLPYIEKVLRQEKTPISEIREKIIKNIKGNFLTESSM
ncbi:MAG TPA: patatin-like phospholipase family protein [bacterium]|nr:patatin-like phospholipase family protein [bacterium]